MDMTCGSRSALAILLAMENSQPLSSQNQMLTSDEPEASISICTSSSLSSSVVPVVPDDVPLRDRDRGLAVEPLREQQVVLAEAGLPLELGHCHGRRRGGPHSDSRRPGGPRVTL